jgi:hypothetical protein
MTKNIKHKQDANFKWFELEAQKLKKYLKTIEYILNTHKAHRIKKSNAQEIQMSIHVHNQCQSLFNLKNFITIHIQSYYKPK